MVNWLYIFMTCVVLLILSTVTGFLVNEVQSVSLIALTFFMALAFLPEEDAERLERWYLNWLLNPIRKVLRMPVWEEPNNKGGSDG